MSASCHSILDWCVVCGVHRAASVRVGVGKPSPSCSAISPLVVACLRFNSVSAPAMLPAPTVVLHMYPPERRGAVDDVRVRLAFCRF